MLEELPTCLADPKFQADALTVGVSGLSARAVGVVFGVL